MCSPELTFMCYFPPGQVVEPISAGNTPLGRHYICQHCSCLYKKEKVDARKLLSPFLKKEKVCSHWVSG